MDIYEESSELHRQKKGKIEVVSKFPVTSKKELSLAYTPGVAGPCKIIAKDVSKAYEYTIKANTVAVVTDGSAVLGLGNIGPEAALPVMEGKALLFKEFAGVDAFPLCLRTQDPDEIIQVVKSIAPGFGGINLEDIAAPKCFRIEEALQDIGIPVFHDDQHGTAIVIAAGLMNALKLVNKELSAVKIVIAGAGAAGIATAKLLVELGAKRITVLDSKGTICQARGDLNEYKKHLSELVNIIDCTGIDDAMRQADVFIGVSAPGIVSKDMIRSMAPQPIVFAMSNPVPEIMPDEAKEAGAAIVATGRSDFPNQINNAAAFPAIFRGALDARAPRITDKMKKAAVKALADHEEPKPDKLLPDIFDKGAVEAVAQAVKENS